MTATSLASGAPVRVGGARADGAVAESGRRRPPRPRGLRRARWVAVLAITIAAVTGGGMLPASAAPAASGASSAPATASDAPAAGVRFTLAPVGSGIVSAGDPLTVSMTVSNDTGAPLEVGAVTLGLGLVPLADGGALDEWLASDAPGADIPVIAEQDVRAIARGESRTFGAMVEADDPALQGREPGVYALYARYTSGSRTFVSTSTMLVPDPDATARVGVIVPITAGERSAGLLTADELTALTADDGALTAQLDAVDATPAILAVDPAIVASIRVLGSAAPPSAREWLDRLMTLPNSRFALQYGDADVAVQLDAGLDRPLVARSLAYALDPVNFEPDELVDPTASPAPTPTPTAAPDEPVLPTQQELLEIGTARANVFWPAAGAADTDMIATLSATAAGATTAVTVIPSTSTVGGASGATVGARAAIGDAAALVYDTGVSDALSTAARTPESALRGASLTEATARLALATRDAGSAPLLVALDRADDRSRVELRSAITAITDAPGVQAVPLGTLVQTEAIDQELQESDPDPARVDAARQLITSERSIEDFATILDDATLLTGPERAALLQIFGVAWIDDAEGWSDAVAEHREATATTLDSVGILPSTTIQLLSPGTDLPFAVRNDLPYRVNVVLFTTPNDFRLDVQQATPVVAEPNSNQGVKVPVQARVGSGQVDLRLQLRSPSGISIGNIEVAEVQVRADWEAYGITALAVVVTSLLAIGLFRTIRRRRRARARTAQSADDADAPDAGGAPAGIPEQDARAGDAPDEGSGPR